MNILVVTEKHKIASEIANILHESKIVKHQTAQYSNAYQFQVTINNEQKNLIVIHNSGHNCEYKFVNDSIKNSLDYFSEDQQIKSVVTQGGQEYVKSVKQFINEVDMIVMAQDNDREGEHIAWESVELAAKQTKKVLDVYPGALPKMRVFDRQQIVSNGKGDAIVVRRCKFSSMTRPKLLAALSTLYPLDANVVDAVDARMRLDLRIGYAMSSLQAMNKRKIVSMMGTSLDQSLEAMKLTFGTCQVPTLSLCYNRPPGSMERMSKLSMKAQSAGVTMSTKAVPEAIAVDQSLKCMEALKAGEVKVEVTDEECEIAQPCPLNTIGLQKALAEHNSKQVMEAAEKLYVNGRISYPRTETQYFTEQVNIQAILKILNTNSAYKDYIQSLCSDETAFKTNLDDVLRENALTKTLYNDKAHSPIVITGPLEGNWSELERAVYDYVARHFLASIGKKCLVVKRHFHSNLDCLQFKAEKEFIKDPGWKEILFNQKKQPAPQIDEEILQQIKQINLDQCNSKSGEKDAVTQCELIERMERYGIGTDATIAEHINTIKDRQYVDDNYNVLQSGQILCNLYQHVDLNVLSCAFRCVMEAGLRDISTGRLDVTHFYNEMIEYGINLHQKVSAYLQAYR